MWSARKASGTREVDAFASPQVVLGIVNPVGFLRQDDGAGRVPHRAGFWAQGADMAGDQGLSMTDKALVLFSGGQDSTVSLAWALERFAHVETVGFDYGQKHRVELDVRPNVLRALRDAFPAWGAKLALKGIRGTKTSGEPLAQREWSALP